MVPVPSTLTTQHLKAFSAGAVGPLPVALALSPPPPPLPPQPTDHEALVTRFPVQECAISCATTLASDRSPASSVGVTKVRQGFSMPPGV